MLLVRRQQLEQFSTAAAGRTLREQGVHGGLIFEQSSRAAEQQSSRTRAARSLEERRSDQKLSS
ncbi:uncharacterized protein V6R79_019241 [Siganus canaliculatus]